MGYSGSNLEDYYFYELIDHIIHELKTSYLNAKEVKQLRTKLDELDVLLKQKGY